MILTRPPLMVSMAPPSTSILAPAFCCIWAWDLRLRAVLASSVISLAFKTIEPLVSILMDLLAPLIEISHVEPLLAMLICSLPLAPSMTILAPSF